MGENTTWYEIKAQGERHAKLNLFGDIVSAELFPEDEIDLDETGAKQFINKLNELDVDSIDLTINSPGGSVFAGTAIYNALIRHQATVNVKVDGLAASIASVIAMAGDSIEMADTALMMIHDPMMLAAGNSDELRRSADLLDQVKETLLNAYEKRASLSREDIAAAMSAETWMTAEEAQEFGFIDSIFTGQQVAAAVNPQRFLKTPESVARRSAQAKAGVEAPEPSSPESSSGRTSDRKEDDGNHDGGSAMTDKAQDTAADEAKAREQVRAEEQERKEAVKAVFDGFPHLTDLKQQCIEDMDCTADEARRRALNKLSEGAEPLGSDVRIKEDEREKFRDGASQAILARAGLERPDPGNEFRGSGFLGLAQAALDKAGERPRGYSKGEVINAAITTSTSDYPNVLEDTMRKVLLDAFRNAPRTWAQWTRIGDLTDFRDHSRHKPGSIANLKKFREDGEIPHSYMPDSVKETIAADEYGLIVPLSHKMMVNDDVGYFMQMAQDLGRAASLTIEREVYNVLTNNPKLNENGNQLFSSGNSNLASSGSSISVDSVAAARTAIRKQKDPSGNEFIQPRMGTLLVPEELWDTAQEIMSSNVNPAKSNQTPNVVRNLADVVSTPELSADSATAWYLLANPQDAPVMEVGFVNGEQEPDIQEREAFENRGLQWRVVHDWGVAPIGFRGGYKNPGA